MLRIEFINDQTGNDDSANYKMRVFVNDKQIAEKSVYGHERSTGWEALVRLATAGQCSRCSNLVSFDLSDDFKKCNVLNIRLAAADACWFSCKFFEPTSEFSKTAAHPND